MALRLKAHTADAAILLLYRGTDRKDKTLRGRRYYFNNNIHNSLHVGSKREVISEISSSQLFNKAILQRVPSS